MVFTIRIQSAGQDINIHPNESFLEAALNAALAVDYGCSNGNCGKCRARLVSGKIASLRHSDFVFPAIEREAGGFLMCCATAMSNCEIEVRLADGSDDIEQQEIDVKIRSVEPLDDHLTLLKVQTPRTRRLRFLAGQSAQLSHNDAACTLPIASCPCDDRRIHFHVPSNSQQCSASESLRALRLGATLNLKGPLGDFVLNAESARPRIMLGSSLGLAPIKSIIEHSLALTPDIPVTLLLIESEDRPYPLTNVFRSWGDAFDAFDYQRLTIDAGNMADAVTKRLETLLACATDESEIDIYVAGPATLIVGVKETLKLRSIDTTHLRSESFDEQ